MELGQKRHRSLSLAPTTQGGMSRQPATIRQWLRLRRGQNSNRNLGVTQLIRLPPSSQSGHSRVQRVQIHVIICKKALQTLLHVLHHHLHQWNRHFRLLACVSAYLRSQLFSVCEVAHLFETLLAFA